MIFKNKWSKMAMYTKYALSSGFDDFWNNPDVNASATPVQRAMYHALIQQSFIVLANQDARGLVSPLDWATDIRKPKP